MAGENVSSSAGPEPGAGGSPTQDERTWALLAHLLGIVASFIAPLVIWLVKKEESRFVGDQALEALNFQITVVIAFLVCGALTCVAIGLFLMPVVGIYSLVMAIVAGVKANEGKLYRYPVTLRLIR